METALYVVLLGVTILLTAGWIFVANKEVDIMCEFLYPDEYKYPEEYITSVLIAIALTVLLYTSRNPLWFGIAYSVYMAVSVFGWTRIKLELSKAIAGSRHRLEEEHQEATLFVGEALDILQGYYVRQPNLPRVVTSLVLAIAGLVLSLCAVATSKRIWADIAYLLYIVSIAGLELGLAFYWRWVLYRRIKPYEVKMSEERTRLKRGNHARRSRTR
jgi:hypothetical protein